VTPPPFPHEILGRAATRINNELRGINRVGLRPRLKTPATIEELSALKSIADERKKYAKHYEAGSHFKTCQCLSKNTDRMKVAVAQRAECDDTEVKVIKEL